MSKDAKSAQMIDLDKVTADEGVARLIDHAVKMGASDLYLVANEGHTAAQVRHLGMILPISILPSEKTIEMGRRIIEFRANTAVAAIRKVIGQ